MKFIVTFTGYLLVSDKANRGYRDSQKGPRTVSYTHLTLPTIYSV